MRALTVFGCLQPEEKNKFDGIFESLSPVSGLLSGDKVKPVLINSKLPLDILGKVPKSPSKESWRHEDMLAQMVSHLRTL